METFIIVLLAAVSLFFFYLSLRIIIDMRRHERKFKKDVSILAAVFASSAFGLASLFQDVSIILAVIFSCILVMCCFYRLYKLRKSNRLKKHTNGQLFTRMSFRLTSFISGFSAFIRRA